MFPVPAKKKKSAEVKDSLQVAEGLQLRSRRRPPGFWENEDALDRELSRFITAAWTQHRVDDADGKETYFYNQARAYCKASDAAGCMPRRGMLGRQCSLPAGRCGRLTSSSNCHDI